MDSLSKFDDATGDTAIKIESGSARHIKDIGSDELPIPLANDTLGCPRCRIKLTNRKSKVSVDGTAIGMFDSMACEFCGFSLDREGL